MNARLKVRGMNRACIALGLVGVLVAHAGGFSGHGGAERPHWAWLKTPTQLRGEKDEVVCKLNVGDMVEVIHSEQGQASVVVYEFGEKKHSGVVEQTRLLAGEEAFTYFTELAGQQSHRARALYGRALVRLFGSPGSTTYPDLRRAYEDLSAALASDPRLSRARLERAVILAELGEYDEAVRDITRVAEGSPQTSWLLRKRATWLLRMGDQQRRRCSYDSATQCYRKAIADCDTAVKDESAASESLVLRARLGLRLNEYERALHDLETAKRIRASLDPVELEAMARIGMGQFDRVIREVSRHIHPSDTPSSVYVCRGIAFSEKGLHRNAIEDFLSASRKNPTRVTVVSVVASAWVRGTCPVAEIRDADLALSDARKAITLALANCVTSERGAELTPSPAELTAELLVDLPNAWVYCDVMGAALAEAGRYDEATAWARESLKRAPPTVRRAIKARHDLYQTGEAFRSDAAATHGYPAMELLITEY